MVSGSPASRYINLGCGGCYHPDWTNVDCQVTGPGVIAYDLTQGIPFPDESFSVAYHSHLLEHLPKSAAEPFLRECYRVLQPSGTLRVAVPDLEQIARLYLTALEKASQGDPEWSANYEWILLEMYDQVVRDRSGGEMLVYLSQKSLPNEAFVLSRLGVEGEQMLASIRASGSVTRPDSPQTPEQAIAFRQCGEIHQWMYDRHSLGILLQKAGFRDIKVCTAFDSRMADFGQYCLDTTPDGRVRKADSLFMEASK
ncbi:MAG: methyltransferase domain-containing protein [Spirulinaceae cyanobacterium RM2_2_10]|nr:methyltransferase domain-containing protein [Spirulinaceae cyanobacterium RM2_2_10]